MQQKLLIAKSIYSIMKTSKMAWNRDPSRPRTLICDSGGGDHFCQKEMFTVIHKMY